MLPYLESRYGLNIAAASGQGPAHRSLWAVSNNGFAQDRRMAIREIGRSEREE